MKAPHRPRLRAAIPLTALALIAGCTEYAGLYPSVPEVPVATTPAPATPSPVPSVPRLQGTVVFRDKPVVGALLRAYDVATGQGVALAYRPSASKLDLLARETGITTNSIGEFNLTAPAIGPGRIIKLVATQGDRTWATFLDAGGRTTARAPGRYGVTQLERSVAVRLNPAGTALTRVLEGVLKLAMRLPADKRNTALARLMARAEAISPSVGDAFARVPNSEQLAVTNQAKANDGSSNLLRALAETGLTQAMTGEVTSQMRTLTTELSASAPDARGLFPLHPDDFPLGTFTQAADGRITWVAPDGTTVSAPAGVADQIGVPQVLFPPEVPLTLPYAEFDPGEAPGAATGTLAVSDGSLVDPTASEGVAP